MGDLIAGPWPKKPIPPGEPPMDTTLETRVAVIETDVSHIKDDVREVKNDLRILLGALVGGFLILAGLLAHGFHWF